MIATPTTNRPRDPSAEPPPEDLTDAETASAPVPAPDLPSQSLGYLFAAIGAVLFSTKAIAIKLAYQESVDAETLLALRMILSLPFYVAIGLWSLRDRRKGGRPLPGRRLLTATIGVGLLGYWVSSYLDFLGLEYISAQTERLILFTYPLFVVIFGALFFRQPVAGRAIVAIAISYAGLVVIFGQNAIGGGRAAVVGGLFVLAAAVIFALYQLFAKTLIGEMGPRLFTCITMTAAAAGALLQFVLTHPASALMVSPRLWAISLFIAIGATVLPSFFISAALHRVSAQANATIGTVSPVITIVLGYLVLGERLSPVAWLGTALVLAGVGWFTLAGEKPAAASGGR